MSEDKTYPTHRISFSEITPDDRGRDTVGRPVEVAAVFPREGKQGGIIKWNIQPEKLGDGVYFMLENERSPDRSADAFDQAETNSKAVGVER